VIGPGRAGRARIRALERSSRARLVRTVGRGDSLAEALADPAVHALFVCTPNQLHAEAARAALGAGKHALVEFPLAATAGEARALFERARGAGRVLHVEHIELLAPSQAWLRERVRTLGAPREGEVRFSGDAAGWIAQPELAGSAPLCALARLHRLVDLFGSAEVRAARLEASVGARRLEVELGFAGGGRVRLVESRAPGLARSSEWAVECARGRLDSPPAEPPGELFARDLEVFSDRVDSGAASYVSEARELEVLELVGAMEAKLC